MGLAVATIVLTVRAIIPVVTPIMAFAGIVIRAPIVIRFPMIVGPSPIVRVPILITAIPRPLLFAVRP